MVAPDLSAGRAVVESSDEQRVAECWRCIADACVEGDVEHERRALAELAGLVQRRSLEDVVA